MHPWNIPDHWSPEQALAVYHVLNDLSHQLWERYQLQLIPLLQAERDAPDHTPQLALFEPHDERAF